MGMDENKIVTITTTPNGIYTYKYVAIRACTAGKKRRRIKNGDSCALPFVYTCATISRKVIFYDVSAAIKWPEMDFVLS